jgi:copper transport protein
VNPDSVNPPADRAVDVLYAVARFLAFAGFAVLVGGVVFLAVCWPSGADRDDVLALVERAWALLVLGSLGSFLLQGVYGSGTPLTHATHPQLIESTLKSPLGVTLTVRVVILILLVPLRNQLYRLAAAGREDRILVVVVWSLVGAVLAGTWAGADHASVGIQAPLAILADSAHLFSLACWIGGLVTLAVLVLRAPGNSVEPGEPSEPSEPSDAGESAAAMAVAGFSRVATWSVGFVAVTGVYGAWRGVGSWGALTGTTYGRLVLVKIAAFAGLLGLGYLSGRSVSKVRAATPGPDTPIAPDSGIGPDLRRLRRTVSVEACVAAGVLVVSALLVDTRTGRESVSGPPPAAAASASFDTRGIGGQGILQAELTPARPGRNTLRLDLLDPAGHAYTPAELTVTLTLAARGIGPLKVPVAADGPGVYAAALDGVSLPGSWTLAVTVRSDEIDETTVRVPLTVR